MEYANISTEEKPHSGHKSIERKHLVIPNKGCDTPETIVQEANIETSISHKGYYIPDAKGKRAKSDTNPRKPRPLTK
jgi:hypothetical protein